ncbi:MAG TPA: hypothetical protein PKK40_06160 [Marmoricola sp.]|nr:hypothetical protein [Marmoricola sp.]
MVAGGDSALSRRVLCRELTTGALTGASLVSVVYLLALYVGVRVIGRRLERLLLP